MNALVKTTSDLGLDKPATWDMVSYWAEMAAKFQHASVAAQVMAGFALLELRKNYGTNQGKRKDLTSPHAVEKLAANNELDWPERVKTSAGISDETARRWMAMAQGIRAKWKKLAPQDRLRELMAVSPNEWSDTDTKLVCDSLHKVADGQTQLEFMRELGLAKKKTGNPNATGGRGKKLSTAEAAAAMREFALENSGAMGKAVEASNRDFHLLTDVNDLEVQAQIALLDAASARRKKWVNTPKAKRSPEILEEMGK